MNKLELKEYIEALQAQYDAMPDEPVRLFEVSSEHERYNFIDGYLDIDWSTRSLNSGDDDLIKIGNHFTERVEAERMAAFIRKNFLYWRMALKFADGYEFKSGEDNAYVYKYGSSIDQGYSRNCKDLGTIYMTKENAKAFADFCNKHEQELGL